MDDIKSDNLPSGAHLMPVLHDRIISAALTVAEQQAWDMVTMRDIAIEAGISLAQLYEHFYDRSDILAAFERRVDIAVLKAFESNDLETPPRDRLFDILMERFDVLNQNRAAVQSILRSHKLDPKQLVIALPHFGASMARMLEAASIDSTGLRGAARVLGLQIVYLWALRTWMNDDSADLSKTMATLDQALNRAESVVNSIGF